MLTNLYNTHILHQNKVTSIERVEGSYSRTPLFPDGLAAFLCLGFPPNKKTTRQRIKTEGSFEAIIASLEQILSVLFTAARCENIDF